MVTIRAKIDVLSSFGTVETKVGAVYAADKTVVRLF